jgi:phage shock protein PspC (stress-responsive transcriptional regulator)
MIAGVCGGLGEYFDIDPVIIRLIFIILAFANGIGIIAYIFFWIALPKGPIEVPHKEDKIQSVIEEASETIEEVGEKIKGKIGDERKKRSFWFGILLIAIGVFLLLANYGLFNFNLLAPIFIIAIGGYLLFKSMRD